MVVLSSITSIPHLAPPFPPAKSPSASIVAMVCIMVTSASYLGFPLLPWPLSEGRPSWTCTERRSRRSAEATATRNGSARRSSAALGSARGGSRFPRRTRLLSLTSCLPPSVGGLVPREEEGAGGGGGASPRARVEIEVQSPSPRPLVLLSPPLPFLSSLPPSPSPLSLVSPLPCSPPPPPPPIPLLPASSACFPLRL